MPPILNGYSIYDMIVVSLGHSLNASIPILVTLLGIVTEVRLLHLQNAEFPMLVTLLGMVMKVRLVHS